MGLADKCKNKEMRIATGKQSMLAFGWIYLSEYFNFVSAPFHKKYAHRLENDNITRLAECDFRESGKSVLTTLIYILWNICYNKRKFILIGSETKTLATLHLSSIINALQTSKLLIEDFGVLYFENRKIDDISKKKTVSDFITENNIRVTAISKGESIRGMRHLRWRPDLFVGDDLDSMKSVLNVEQRDKTYNWIKAEVLSGMNQEYGKAVCIGNMIHFDCIMARFKKDPQWDYGEVPIYDDGKLSWEDRYFWTKEEADIYNKKTKTKEDKKTSIEQIRSDKGSLIFAQEYLLQPMSSEERIFKPEWIQYYENLPTEEWREVKGYIDPAAKQKETSDYSAIAIGVKDKRDGKIYIPYVWQGKISEKEKAEKIYTVHTKWQTQEFLCEDNAYQDVLRQRVADLIEQNKYVPIRGVTTVKDKISRALAVQPYIERGDVLFSKNLNTMTKITGDVKSQGVIDQMIQFPIAPNDDMVDAIIGVIHSLITGQNFEYNNNKDEAKPLTENLMNKNF